jgi:hypothetical protein
MRADTVNQGRRPVLGAFRRRGLSAVAAVAVVVGTASAALTAAPANAVVGNGFVLTAADLSYILKQVTIAERHSYDYGRDFAATVAGGTRPNHNPATDPSFCLSMVGPAKDQIPDPLTSYGLRTVDGSCNNLVSVLDSRG